VYRTCTVELDELEVLEVLDAIMARVPNRAKKLITLIPIRAKPATV
jgi:hypothetical protein